MSHTPLGGVLCPLCTPDLQDRNLSGDIAHQPFAGSQVIRTGSQGPDHWSNSSAPIHSSPGKCARNAISGPTRDSSESEPAFPQGPRSAPEGLDSLVAQMVKCLPAMQGNPASIPGSGRSPGEGNGNPLQYPCLENSMEGGAWWVYSPRGCRESDRTQRLHFLFFLRVWGFPRGR